MRSYGKLAFGEVQIPIEARPTPYGNLEDKSGLYRRPLVSDGPRKYFEKRLVSRATMAQFLLHRSTPHYTIGQMHKLRQAISK